MKKGEWNEYHIRCEGPHIQLWINDVLTVDYTEADASIDQSGYIGLQCHTDIVQFRNIRIQEL